MIIKNKRGETLVESLVSLLILTIAMLLVVQIISFSSRLFRESNDKNNEFNQAVTAIEKDGVDAANVATVATDVKINFKLEGGDPDVDEVEASIGTANIISIPDQNLVYITAETE